MSDILQNQLPYDSDAPRGLPGIAPLDMADWLIFDDAFAPQMHERARLLAADRGAVLAMDKTACLAAMELLDLVLDQAYGGVADRVTRRDGVGIAINRDDPLGTLAHLVQEDFCILQKIGDEHILTGAILCFPASWKLSEKFMRPLVAIHDGVDEYDANIAKRVQRMFDGVRPGRPLWRSNVLWYRNAELYQPRSIHDPRRQHDGAGGDFLRSERQCIVRLPQSGAVVFSIHTFVVARNTHEPADTPA